MKWELLYWNGMEWQHRSYHATKADADRAADRLERWSTTRVRYIG